MSTDFGGRVATMVLLSASVGASASTGHLSAGALALAAGAVGQQSPLVGVHRLPDFGGDGSERGAESDNNRVLVAFMGDGFRESRLYEYEDVVDQVRNGFWGVSPFDQYAPAFAAYRLDIVSVNSGIDNDPQPGIERDTALGTGIWCSGVTDMCLDSSSAMAMLDEAALDPDLTIVLANSWQGAGSTHSGNTAVVTARHPDAVSFLMPEVGRAFALLRYEDEVAGRNYWYDFDPGYANVGFYNEQEMSSQGVKWADWLGEPDPSGGVVGAYEGGFGYETGIYRSSQDSAMRTVGMPYNAVSREAIVKRIYRFVSTIDDATPGSHAQNGTIFWVDPLPVNHDHMVIQWYVDGQALPGRNGQTLNTAQLGLHSGQVVQVRVTDMTPFVRDEAYRASDMSDYRQWTLDGPGGTFSPADMNQDGVVDGVDVGIWQQYYYDGRLEADMNHDDKLNGIDAGIFLSEYASAGGAGA